MLDLVSIQFCYWHTILVLALEILGKGSSAPSMRSPVVTEEKMRPGTDCGQCLMLFQFFDSVGSVTQRACDPRKIFATYPQRFYSRAGGRKLRGTWLSQVHADNSCYSGGSVRYSLLTSLSTNTLCEWFGVWHRSFLMDDEKIWRSDGDCLEGKREKLSGLFCVILCATIVHSAMHTHMNRPNSSLDWVLSHWAHFTVLRFIFVLCITVCCMHA